EADSREPLELPDVVRKLDELGVVARVREDPVVDEELHVGDAARVLLDIERAGFRERELLPHSAPHLRDLLLELRPVDVRDEHVAPNRLESAADNGRACESAAAQQRLMLPNPGVRSLVVTEAFEARDEQARSAARPKASVDFVQAARARLNRKKMDEPLYEAAEEALVVERRHTIGLLLSAARIVQEDEIEVGAVTELEARKLAVANHREPRIAQRWTATRLAVLRRELAPSGAQRVVENELGRVGQPIADLHERQRSQPVGDGDAEYRRALKYADRVQHLLHVAIRDTLGRALEQRRELLARRRRLEHASIEQLV